MIILLKSILEIKLFFNYSQRFISCVALYTIQLKPSAIASFRASDIADTLPSGLVKITWTLSAYLVPVKI